MKRLLTGLILAAQLAVSGAAQASVVTIDFSQFAAVGTAINVLPVSDPTSGVYFQFFNDSTEKIAYIDNTGLHGVSPINLIDGYLELDFASAPGLARSLSLNFNFAGTFGTGTVTALDLIFKLNNDNLAYDTMFLTNYISGTAAIYNYNIALNPSVTPFDAVQIYFAPEATGFNVTAITYVDTVPEPSTMILLTISLATCVGGIRFIRRKA